MNTTTLGPFLWDITFDNSPALAELIVIVFNDFKLSDQITSILHLLDIILAKANRKL